MRFSCQLYNVRELLWKVNGFNILYNYVFVFFKKCYTFIDVYAVFLTLLLSLGTLYVRLFGFGYLLIHIPFDATCVIHDLY